MKNKLIILLVITFLFISGCSNATKEETVSKKDNKSGEVTEQEKEDSNSTESENNVKQEEVTGESTNNQQQNNTSAETPTSNEVENTVQVPAQPTCTPKKFDNTYSYVYTTQEECKKEGNIAFMNITDNEDSDIFAYGCCQIVDECGTTYYGVIFYNAPDSVVYR